MKSTFLLSAILSLSSYTAAWPWPEPLPAVKDVYGVERMYMKRQGTTISKSRAEKMNMNNSRTILINFSPLKFSTILVITDTDSNYKWLAVRQQSVKFELGHNHICPVGIVIKQQ